MENGTSLSNSTLAYQHDASLKPSQRLYDGSTRERACRRVTERYRRCPECNFSEWRKFASPKEAGMDENFPQPCKQCGHSFMASQRLKRGWIYEPFLK